MRGNPRVELDSAQFPVETKIGLRPDGNVDGYGGKGEGVRGHPGGFCGRRGAGGPRPLPSAGAANAMPQRWNPGPTASGQSACARCSSNPGRQNHGIEGEAWTNWA